MIFLPFSLIVIFVNNLIDFFVFIEFYFQGEVWVDG